MSKILHDISIWIRHLVWVAWWVDYIQSFCVKFSRYVLTCQSSLYVPVLGIPNSLLTYTFLHLYEISTVKILRFIRQLKTMIQFSFWFQTFVILFVLSTYVYSDKIRFSWKRFNIETWSRFQGSSIWKDILWWKATCRRQNVRCTQMRCWSCIGFPWKSVCFWGIS